MLYLFNLKLKNKDKIENKVKKDLMLSTKIQHFTPAVKEWNSSIYTFNKNSISLIPVTNKLIISFINNYFNMYNTKLESKIRQQTIRIKSRRLSSHIIYVSKGEFKYTNTKVIINIYIHNRQKLNYLYKIKKNSKKKIFLLTKRLLKIKKKILKKSFYYLKKYHFLKKNVFFYNKYLQYYNTYVEKLIKKSIKRHLSYIYYKRLLIVNELKFKYTYLNKIINLINKIYNKTIQLNIIDLKYFYLNSDIFTKYVTDKILKDRNKLNSILKFSVRKVKVINKKTKQNYDNINMLSQYNFIKVNKIEHFFKETFKIREKNKKKIFFNRLRKIYLLNFSKYKIRRKIMNSIENKFITGIRLQAAGRLSRRYTASRSLHKLRYKGSLREICNINTNLSSKMVKGTFKPNIQYTNLNSTVRIGSFGIKGWLSNN